jgi:Uma2 family endonuclease
MVERPATYADLEAVPPHLVAEILFGRLVTHPRPAAAHAIAGNALSDELTSPFQKGRGGPGGWIFMFEPELHLGPHVVVPDIAAWRRERMSSMPEKSFIEAPPDWVCGVISPSTQIYDRGAKRRIYATYGVGHLWLLHPLTQMLEVFELREAQWVLFETYQGSEQVKAPPFDAVPLSLADVFPLGAPTSQE